MNNNGINTHSVPVKQMVNVYAEKQGVIATVKGAFGRSVQEVPSTRYMIQVEVGKIINVPKDWIIKSIADPVSYYPQRVSPLTSTQTSPLIPTQTSPLVSTQTSPLIPENTSHLTPEKSRTMASDEAPRHNAPQTNQAKGHHQHRGPKNEYAKLLQKNGSLTSTRDFNVVANHLTSALHEKGFPVNTPTLATQTIQDMAHDMALYTAKDVEEFLDGVDSYEQYMAFLTPHVKNEQPTITTPVITTPVSNPGYKKKGSALNNNKPTSFSADSVMEELTKKLAKRNLEREKVSAPSNEQPIITASVSNPGNEKTGDVLNDNKSTPAEPISILSQLRTALQDKGVALDAEAHSDSPGALTGSDELSAEYDDDEGYAWDDEAEDWDNYDDWPGNDLKTASTPLNPYENIGALNSSVHSESPQGDLPENSDAHNDKSSAASNPYENIDVLNSSVNSESQQDDLTENYDTHLYATVDKSRKATASEDMSNAGMGSLEEAITDPLYANVGDLTETSNINGARDSSIEPLQGAAPEVFIETVESILSIIENVSDIETRIGKVDNASEEAAVYSTTYPPKSEPGSDISSYERKKYWEDRKSDALTALSAIAGHKLTDGNPDIANLGDPNRPLKVSDQLASLYTDQWTDAQEVLETDTTIKGGRVEKFLREILFHSYDTCMLNKDQTNQDKELILLKNFENNTDLENVNFGEGDVRTYCNKCIEICSHMVNQDPPMVFDRSMKTNDKIDPSTHVAYTQSGVDADFLVWPPVYLHKDGPLLAKGVVQPQSKPRAFK